MSEHNKCGCGGTAVVHQVSKQLGPSSSSPTLDCWVVQCPGCSIQVTGTSETEAWQIWDKAISRPLTSGNHLGVVRNWIKWHADEPGYWGSQKSLQFRHGGPSCYDLERLAEDIRETTVRELHHKGLVTVESLGLLRGALPKEDSVEPKDPMAYYWLVLQARNLVEQSRKLNVEELVNESAIDDSKIRTENGIPVGCRTCDGNVMVGEKSCCCGNPEGCNPYSKRTPDEELK